MWGKQEKAVASTKDTAFTESLQNYSESKTRWIGVLVSDINSF